MNDSNLKSSENKTDILKTRQLGENSLNQNLFSNIENLSDENNENNANEKDSDNSQDSEDSLSYSKYKTFAKQRIEFFNNYQQYYSNFFLNKLAQLNNAKQYTLMPTAQGVYNASYEFDRHRPASQLQCQQTLTKPNKLETKIDKPSLKLRLKIKVCLVCKIKYPNELYQHLDLIFPTFHKDYCQNVSNKKYTNARYRNICFPCCKKIFLYQYHNKKQQNYKQCSLCNTKYRNKISLQNFKKLKLNDGSLFIQRECKHCEKDPTLRLHLIQQQNKEQFMYWNQESMNKSSDLKTEKFIKIDDLIINPINPIQIKSYKQQSKDERTIAQHQRNEDALLKIYNTIETDQKPQMKNFNEDTPLVGKRCIECKQYFTYQQVLNSFQISTRQFSINNAMIYYFIECCHLCRKPSSRIESNRNKKQCSICQVIYYNIEENFYLNKKFYPASVPKSTQEQNQYIKQCVNCCQNVLNKQPWKYDHQVNHFNQNQQKQGQVVSIDYLLEKDKEFEYLRTQENDAINNDNINGKTCIKCLTHYKNEEESFSIHKKRKYQSIRYFRYRNICRNCDSLKKKYLALSKKFLKNEIYINI